MLKMPESDKNSILQGREITELSGQETKEIIDNLAETNQAIIPASEKQLALIIRLVDKLNLDLSKLLSDIGISDISDLTGGREGNASELIGNLIDLDRESPATEKQKEAITSMSDKLEIPIEQAMELVMAESFDKITKSEASGLISSLKKTISNNRRKRK